jgi:uncharacterized protein YqjF (DUF2071 family)
LTNASAVQPHVFLTAEWRYLAMLNYEVDDAALRPLVPPGTELDRWNGQALVSLVAFWFQDVRVFGWAVPFHTDFEEVNLRFYVRRKASEGWRRGVVFIKEIVPRRAVAAVARAFYNERYIALPMRHRFGYEPDEPMLGPQVEYAWRFRGQWNSLKARAAGWPEDIRPESEEEFITEHYWGYSAQRSGACLEYEVEHPRWVVWPLAEHRLECDAKCLYGDAFAEALQDKPRSAFLAYGSPVTVRRGQALQEG